MVVVGGEKYAIPLDSIQTIEDVDPAEIKLVSNKEVITLRGNVCPLVRMNEVLDNETTRDPNENMVVVVVRKGDQQAGLIIDELIGQDLTKAVCGDLEKHAYSVNDGIADAGLRNMHVLAGV